jgi:hypothetical protein
MDNTRREFLNALVATVGAAVVKPSRSFFYGGGTVTTSTNAATVLKVNGLAIYDHLSVFVVNSDGTTGGCVYTETLGPTQCSTETVLYPSSEEMRVVVRGTGTYHTDHTLKIS